MRSVKPPQERKQEIMDTAKRLFFENGYTKTKITDIINTIGMSKGIFYYYFESKEDIMNAIIAEVINNDIKTAKTIAEDSSLSAHQKVYGILSAHREKITENYYCFIKQFNHLENPEILLKTINLAVSGLLPLLVDAVNQGICEGVFELEYPYETLELLLSAHTFQTFFGGQPLKTEQKKAAFIRMLENALGAGKGSFDYLHELMKHCQ